MFYLYVSDCSDAVRCFQCGIGLSGWEEEDDPYVEHARWAPRCEYIIAKKGQEFVNLVAEAAAEESHGGVCWLLRFNTISHLMLVKT